jgi:membrane fusion protein, multidrug efflux system
MDTRNPDGPLVGGSQVRPKPSRGKTIRRFVVMVIALAILGGALYGFNQFRKQAIANYFATNVPPPTKISAVKAKSEAMPRYLEGIGSLVAVHQVTLAPQLAGRVTKIMFESGAEVKQGEQLVQLDDAVEQGDLLNYQAMGRLAGANLSRNRTLARQDFATQATLDQYQSQLDQARGMMAKTEAQIAQKRIVAPFSGVLGVRQIDLGQYLQAGTPVVTLTDLDTLYTNFTLPEQNRGAVAVGQSVQIRVDAFAERVFDAKITAIEPQIDPQTRTMKVQASLANPEHVLLPGMYANARVVLAPEEGVVTVPETAVDYSAYGESVYVVQEAGKAADGKPALKAVQTFVQSGTRHNGMVAIVSGLRPGDMVVTSGQVKLHNGSAVSISNDAALTVPAKPSVN